MAEREMSRIYPEGTFVSIGVAIGAGLGVPIGLLFGDPAFLGVGVGIGAGLGVAIGAAVEARVKQRGQIRPLSAEERRQRRRWATIALTAGAVVGIGVLMVFLLVR